jgi:hypothetical protein
MPSEITTRTQRIFLRRDGIVQTLACLLVLAAQAGCKSRSSDSGPGASRATPGANLCGIVTPGEAAEVLGVASFEVPQISAVRPLGRKPEGTAPVTMCTFADARHTTELKLRFETGRTFDDFIAMRKLHDEMGQKTIDYPELGEVAATFSAGPINGVTFFQRGTIVMLEGSHLETGHLAALAKMIAARR